MEPESPQSVAQAPPLDAGASTPGILAALNALLASLRLYGPGHPVTTDAAGSLSALVEHASTGWVRVLGDGFTDGAGARVAGSGLADLARGLSAANVAAIGFFGPCPPGALIQAGDALARLASRASTIHDEVARLSAAAGDAVRVMPLSAGRVALDSALCGGATPVDWGRLLDQLFDDAAASLQALSDQGEPNGPTAPDAPPGNPLVSIGEVLAHTPRDERSGAMRQLRDRLAGLSPEQRGRLLDLEPGKPDSHYDAIAAVVEALPTSEVAAAIDGAVTRTGAVSPHTIRILSKLIAVSRDDPQGRSAVQDLLDRTRDRVSKGSSPDPAVRAALETLLAAAGQDEYNPEAYDQTLRTLVRPDATPPDRLPLEWDLPAAQACHVAQAIALGEDATPQDRIAHIEIVRRKLAELLDGRALDPIVRALSTTYPEAPAGDLGRDLAQPPALRSLAQAAGASPDAERIMRALGPEAGALALTLAAQSTDARLAGLAALSGPWPTVVARAAALDPLAAADALAPAVGLNQPQRDALSGALLALDREEIADKVMAVFLAHGLTWSAAAINHALASPDNATVASALPHLVAGKDPACLPPLGDCLCGNTPAHFSLRTYRRAARAMGASGELGLQALATVTRALALRPGVRALARLALLGQTLERCRNSEPIRLLRRDASVPRVRPILLTWAFIAWLREER